MKLLSTRVASSTWHRSVVRATAAGLLAAACSDGGITVPPTAASLPVSNAAVVRDSSGAARSQTGVAAALSNGGNFSGTISVAAQIDTWTFAATQGQFLVVAIGEITGSVDFTPWIRLVAPNGVTIGNTWNTAAAQLGVAAPVTGTYTVLVGSADSNHDGTGTYRLSAAQLQGNFVVSPGDQGGAMTNGATHTGTTDVGDVDLWSISANQGDLITVAVGEVTGSVDYEPWIRIIAPNGALLGNSWNTAAAQVSVAAPSTGEYTVIIYTADVGNDATGTSTVTAAKGPGAITVSPGDQGGPITNGATNAGTLTVGDLDSWTFNATQGDYIILAVGEVTGTDFTPWIRLVSPNGTLIGNSWNSGAAQNAVTAPLTGTYLVIISSADVGNDGFGTYNLTLAKGPGAVTVSPGDQGGPMTNGLMHTGTLFVGDLDTYTFSANQGDGIVLTAGEITGTDFTPWVRLVAPNGSLLGNTWNTNAATMQVNAPITGTYTVVVSSADVGNDGFGDYRLTLGKGPGAVSTSPGDEGGAATNGGNNLGVISTGDIDVYTFTSNAGLPFAVSVGEAAGSAADFTPWIRVIAPNGTIVGNTWNTNATQFSAIAQVSGTFTVIVGSADVGNDATGNYRLVVQRAGAFVTPPGDEGGPMTNGAVHTGTIDVGDLDRWTFAANQGETFAVAAGELTGTDFTPWLRLVSPSGVVLANTWNAVVAQLQVTAPETGNYTIAIGSADVGNDGSGTYHITLARGTGPFVVSPGDQGGPVSNGIQNGTIAVGGDLDMWSLTATQGSPLSLTVTEVSGTTDYTPWIRLVSPNGTLIGNTWGSSGGTINLSAPLTGTYTIILGSADTGNDGNGTYTLSIAGANLAPQPHRGDVAGDLKAFWTPRPKSYGLEAQR